MITYQDAKEYVDKGYPVFPVNIFWNNEKKKFEKKPAVEWKPFQDRLPTEEELHRWFDKPRYNGLGLATGRFSGVVVVDVEYDCPEEDRKDIKSSMVVRTISGGWHHYFRWNKELRNTVKIRNNQIDFRGDGGFVAIPPSRCKDKSYIWENRLISPMFLSVLPDWLEKELIAEHFTSEGSRIPVNFNKIYGTKEGSRDNNLYRAACSLLYRGVPSKLVYQFLLWLDSRFQPPLGEAVVKQKFDSAVSFTLRGWDKRGGQT